MSVTIFISTGVTFNIQISLVRMFLSNILYSNPTVVNSDHFVSPSKDSGHAANVCWIAKITWSRTVTGIIVELLDTVNWIVQQKSDLYIRYQSLINVIVMFLL